MKSDVRFEAAYFHIVKTAFGWRRGRAGRKPHRALVLLLLFGAVVASVAGCVNNPPPTDLVNLTVTVQASDGASGAVVSTPVGIDVDSGTQSAPFRVDTLVRLAATAAEGSDFLGFSPAGVCATGTPPTTCEVRMTSATSVEAVFRSGPTVLTSLDVVASNPVAGAYVELTLPLGSSVSAVTPLRNGALARAAAVGGTVRLAWVAEDAQAGAQVRLTVASYVTIADLALVNQLAVATPGGPNIGVSTLSLEGGSAGGGSGTPLAFDAVDHPVDATLSAAFAEHELGDLDGDGDLSVRDALSLLERSGAGGWTDFQRYHADLDADDRTDLADLERLLDKLVDPELPARLHVKPRSVSFVQLDPATSEDAIVLIANGGRQPLDGLSWGSPALEGVVASQLAGVTGQSVALRLTLPASARRGWLPGFFRVEHEDDAVDVRVGNLVFLVAGQSNAVGIGNPLAGWPETPRDEVRMLGNDYVWRNASEPLDDATNQVDSVSNDGGFVFYSFGTRLGNLLYESTDFPTYLIPAATGSSTTAAWQLGGNLSRSNLRGSATYRAQVSAGLAANPIGAQPFPSEGGPVSAVLWYQGESDRSLRESFVANTNAIMNAFAAELGAPTIAVQLASMCRLNDNARLHAVSELQRRLETGFGAIERSGFHLVVAFDLPRSDCIHLSAFGQRVLAERIELAVREHVLGEDVDGTGPRLVSIQHANDVVTLRTTHVLAPGALDPLLFTVWDGPPAGSPDDEAAYVASSIGVVGAERSASDPTAVRLRLSAPVADPHVRYMARFNSKPGPDSDVPSDSGLWQLVASGVVRAAEGGLPLPAFGPLSSAF